MINVAALAVSLARPVVRGYLPIDQAEAALAVALIHSERAGTSPGSGTYDEKLQLDCSLLRLHIERQERARDSVAQQISRAIRPLIARQESPGRIRAEAHDVNAANDFAFTEPEVEGVIIEALRQARARTTASGPSPRPRRHRGR